MTTKELEKEIFPVTGYYYIDKSTCNGLSHNIRVRLINPVLTVMIQQLYS